MPATNPYRPSIAPIQSTAAPTAASERITQRLVRNLLYYIPGTCILGLGIYHLVAEILLLLSTDSLPLGLSEIILVLTYSGAGVSSILSGHLLRKKRYLLGIVFIVCSVVLLAVGTFLANALSGVFLSGFQRV